MKVLVLYEELAWYFVNCINVLCRDHNCEVLIICKPPDSTAPFKFKYIHPSVAIKERTQFTEEQLLDEARQFKPDFIFLAGWVYKPYINILKKLKPASSMIGFDNQWTGSLKQRIGALYFKFFLKPYVKHAFVPGARQRVFAEHLGFNREHIIEGAYCCDHNLFNEYYKTCKAAKETLFPKRFLFVGRYASEKGVRELWDVFAELSKEHEDWELWCLGKGDVEPVKHEKIKHFGFKQPEEMMEIIKNTGIFVLPSIFEPWGVVVHEYATAGFPLICTDRVGAGDRFLVNEENGFLIKAGNREELKRALEKCMEMPAERMTAMGRKSAELAAGLTPEIWAANFVRAFSK